MPIVRIIYTSESLISPGSAQGEIKTLVDQARCRNVREEISGCLLFSVSHFAQVLEGNELELNNVMDSILRDARHHRIKIIDRKPVLERRFPSWGLGYGGPSLYVTKVIRRASNDHALGRVQGIEDLLKMMSEFAAYSSPQD